MSGEVCLKRQCPDVRADKFRRIRWTSSIKRRPHNTCKRWPIFHLLKSLVRSVATSFGSFSEVIWQRFVSIYFVHISYIRYLYFSHRDSNFCLLHTCSFSTWEQAVPSPSWCQFSYDVRRTVGTRAMAEESKRHPTSLADEGNAHKHKDHNERKSTTQNFVFQLSTDQIPVTTFAQIAFPQAHNGAKYKTWTFNLCTTTYFSDTVPVGSNRVLRSFKNKQMNSRRMLCYRLILCCSSNAATPLNLISSCTNCMLNLCSIIRLFDKIDFLGSSNRCDLILQNFWRCEYYSLQKARDPSRRQSECTKALNLGLCKWQLF